MWLKTALIKLTRKLLLYHSIQYVTENFKNCFNLSKQNAYSYEISVIEISANQNIVGFKALNDSLTDSKFEIVAFKKNLLMVFDKVWWYELKNTERRSTFMIYQINKV